MEQKGTPGLIALIVHGGAWDIPDEMVEAHRNGCATALAAGYCQLESSGGAVAAAVAAVQILEDDPTFDAGYGSFLNREGEVELDAAVMRGSDLRAGAIAGVRRIGNPILVAQKLMEAGDPVFLVGEGAEEFAEDRGLPLCAPTSLHHPREVRRWEESKKAPFDPMASFGSTPSDTVGAVALDSSGEVAVAVSTGGRPFKPRGRVGDSPVLGAGFVAEHPGGGVCCTGWGEGILRAGMARRVLGAMEGRDPVAGCRQGVEFLWGRLGGRGGVIALDPSGRVGFAMNTPRMAVGYRVSTQDTPYVEVVEAPSHSIVSGP